MGKTKTNQEQICMMAAAIFGPVDAPKAVAAAFEIAALVDERMSGPAAAADPDTLPGP